MFALVFQVFNLFWIVSGCSGCVVLFLGGFLLLLAVFKISTNFHIVSVSSGGLVSFICFRLFSFVVNSADLSPVVVGSCVWDLLRL